MDAGRFVVQPRSLLLLAIAFEGWIVAKDEAGGAIPSSSARIDSKSVCVKDMLWMMAGTGCLSSFRKREFRHLS